MKNVAVIGLGNIAKRHRKNLKEIFPLAKVFAVSASGRIPQEKINDADEVLNNLDEFIEKNIELAIIASPATFHKQHIQQLSKLNIPVLIEKPITSSSEDAKDLLETLKNNDIKAAVGYCLRYLPSAKVVKKLLDSNRIGKTINAFVEVGQYLPDWRPGTDYRNSVSASAKLGGGALLELSHELDYIQWLLGDMSVIHGVLRSSDILGLNVEDIVDLSGQTDSGCLVNIHLDFIQKTAKRTCSIIGSEARIDWDLIQNSVTVSSHSGVETIYEDRSWDKNQMYLLMIQDFLDFLQGQENQIITPEDASQTVELISSVKRKFTLRKS